MLGAVDALLEVLVAGPAEEGLVELALVPEASQPLAELIPGSLFLTDGAGSGSTQLGIPIGYAGYLIACQAIVLENNPIGHVMSNAALACLQ